MGHEILVKIITQKVDYGELHIQNVRGKFKKNPALSLILKGAFFLAHPAFVLDWSNLRILIFGQIITCNTLLHNSVA